MSNWRIVVAGIFLAVSVPSWAEQVKSTASNGVVIDVNGDDFAGRYEYTAPVIKLPDNSGFFLVAAIKKQGDAGRPFVTGSVYYTGDWRFYDQAVFRGGDRSEAIFTERKVLSCSGSRYGGSCSHSESFQITPTAAQVAKYAVGGYLDVQISAKGQGAIRISVPTDYLAAVAEVSGGKTPAPQVLEIPVPASSKP